MKKRRVYLRQKLDTHLRICESKKWYETERDALDAADRVMLDHMDVNLGIYRCGICGHWHLTQVNKSN